VILLFACTDPGADSAPVVVSDEEVFTTDPLEPVLAVDDLVPILASVMSDSFYTPLDISVWTDALMAGVADDGPSCPSYDISADAEGAWTSFWGGACDGEAYNVAGDWQYTVQRTERSGSVETFVLELHSVWGETVPDGREFAAGGALRVSLTTSLGTTAMDMEYAGSYREEGHSGPLGDGVSGTLQVLGDLTEAGFVGTLDGSVYGERASVEFVDLEFTEGCRSPAGEVMIRDENSGWWSVMLPDDCLGCGPASYAGVEYDEVCIGPVVHDALEDRLAPYVEGEL
jgi:hypothetical protein